MEPRSKNAADYTTVGVAAPASNDDDVDLFGSEDKEEDHRGEAEGICWKEIQGASFYCQNLDVMPWDDETDIVWDAEKLQDHWDGRPSLGHQQAGPHWVQYQEAAVDGCCWGCPMSLLMSW